MTKRLSIITPIRATPLEYFKHCARSVAEILDSDVPGVEVEWVVVADGDERDIEGVVRGIGILERCASVVRLRNHVGLGAARNAGVRRSSGELLTWLDADDALVAEDFSAFVREGADVIAGMRGAGLVYSDSLDCDPDLNRLSHRDKRGFSDLHREHKGTLNDSLSCVDFIYQSQLMSKDAFFGAGGFTPGLLGEDVDLLLRLSRLSNEINFVHVPVSPYLYRRNPSGICESQWEPLKSAMDGILSEHARQLGYPQTGHEYVGSYPVSQLGLRSLIAPSYVESEFDIYLPSDRGLWPEWISLGS